jgi:BirA family transcriptional regulator, biotin operon repressor / biotin---[acetyl-CoA-carboxylase] ligase
VREPLDVQALREALLTPCRPWRSVDGYETVDSTNLEAARRPEPWRVVVADHQSAGRGRMTRHWEAPAGASVAVSVVVPMAGADRGWLPLLTGMAMADALQRVAGVPARLKWPNDVLVDGGKICGVLCEMVTPLEAAGDDKAVGHDKAVVAGAGANVDQRREELPVDTATSLRLCGVTDVRREDLILAHLDGVAELHAAWVSGGAAMQELRRRYRALCVTIGQDVRVHQPSGAVARGRAVAVDDSGRLVLDGPAGRQAHAAGDVVHVRSSA